WTVIAPDHAFHGTDSDPNNSSIVLRVQLPGFTALLSGDVEPAAQQELLDSGADLRADLLKIPHHGSADQLPAFLAAVHAEVAIVSDGVGNPYGHPAAATLGTLRADGADVFRTDLDGSLAVSARAGHLVVTPSRQLPEHPPPGPVS